ASWGEFSVEEISFPFEKNLALPIRGVNIDSAHRMLELRRAVSYTDVIGKIIKRPLAGCVPAGPTIHSLSPGIRLPIPVYYEDSSLALGIISNRCRCYEPSHPSPGDDYVVVLLGLQFVVSATKILYKGFAARP